MANLDKDEQAYFDQWKRYVEMNLVEGLWAPGLAAEIVELAGMRYGVDSPTRALDIGFGDKADYDPVLGSEQAIALCAILSSNPPNITKLDITLGDGWERSSVCQRCVPFCPLH